MTAYFSEQVVVFYFILFFWEEARFLVGGEFEEHKESKKDGDIHSFLHARFHTRVFSLFSFTHEIVMVHFHPFKHLSLSLSLSSIELT